MSTTHSVNLRPEDVQSTHVLPKSLERPKDVLIWLYEGKKCASDKDSVWML